MRIALINMPFADVRYPSIALTQLRSVALEAFPGRVDPTVHYYNHDFARYFGAAGYAAITSLVGTVAGLGDWLFRSIAFPEQPDNAEEYFRRHAPRLALDATSVAALLERRAGLEAFLEDLIERDRLADCGLAGFTTMFSQSVASFAMARLLKQRNPDLVTAIGGANCETSMGRVLARRVDAMDFVFSGPALVNFPEMVGCLLAGRRDDCHRITGVFSKRKVALQVMGGRDEIGEELDLDREVALDYEDFLASFAQLPDHDAEPHLFFETSRGCWWGQKSHCTFCGLNGSTMSYRAMSPAVAVRQFERMFEFAPRVTRFDSVDNILPREYLTEVLPKLQPPPGTSMFYEVKADLKDREMQVLAAAGVRRIQPGIESLSTTTLKLMRKGTTAFQNLRFLKSCLRWDIEPIWGLLIGFPGEDESVYEKYLRDLPRFAHLPPPSGVYPIRFDRYSPYFTNAAEYGLQLAPYDFYRMIYPFAAKEVADLAYFFVDENVDADYAKLSAKWIVDMRAAVAAWRERWSSADAPPELSLRGSDEQPVVFDTRSGTPIEHEIDVVDLRLLDALATPRKVARLLSEMSGLTESDVVSRLGDLVARGLVFEEDERFMSLLLDVPVPTVPVPAASPQESA